MRPWPAAPLEMPEEESTLAVIRMQTPQGALTEPAAARWMAGEWGGAHYLIITALVHQSTHVLICLTYASPLTFSSARLEPIKCFM